MFGYAACTWDATSQSHCVSESDGRFRDYVFRRPRARGAPARERSAADLGGVCVTKVNIRCAPRLHPRPGQAPFTVQSPSPNAAHLLLR